LKIIHLVPHINQEASGVTAMLGPLSNRLANFGHQTEICCLAVGEPISNVSLSVYRQWPVLSRFAVSTECACAMRLKAKEVDIIHNHSLWSMVNVAAGWAVPGFRAKLVTSPHGTLSSWALERNRLVKKLLWLLQRRTLSQADLLHATSEEEYYDIRALGFQSPIMIVPNGIDIPEIPKIDTANEIDSRTLLFLSRIHPTKGIDRLLQAWTSLHKRHPQWRLVVAGFGAANHVKDVTALASSLRLERVLFPGPLYGEAKKQAYFGADLFVLPTHSENFGMVVAEALAHSTPAVVSRGAPWSGLETEGCGWWIEHDVPTLIAALDCAMSMPASQLAEMGRKGRAWMERDFGWESIARRMEAGYRWIIEGGAPPAWVRVK